MNAEYSSWTLLFFNGSQDEVSKSTFPMNRQVQPSPWGCIRRKSILFPVSGWSNVVGTDGQGAVKLFSWWAFGPPESGSSKFHFFPIVSERRQETSWNQFPLFLSAESAMWLWLVPSSLESKIEWKLFKGEWPLDS